MSDFSPILVLQIKICIKPDRHGKDSNKIWETHSFWRNICNDGAIWLHIVICNWHNPRSKMQAVWLSIQRNHPFSHEHLLLWRLMYWGCHNSFDAPSLASSDTSYLQLWHYPQSDSWIANFFHYPCLHSSGWHGLKQVTLGRVTVVSPPRTPPMTFSTMCQG